MPVVHLIALPPDELELLLADAEAYRLVRGLTFAPCEQQVKETAEMVRGFYEKLPAALPWCSYFAADEDRRVLSGCGFKTAPIGGAVEFGYGTFPPHQNLGVATEMAKGLVRIAAANGVKAFAHTLAVVNASGRALAKAGFTKVGEAFDPEDGPVWRWEHLG